MALSRLETFCHTYLTDHPDTRYFLFGHLHVVARRQLSPAAEMLVLGDWLTHFTYARFDGTCLEIHTFSAAHAAEGNTVR